jgi:hypothetical protein
MTRYFLDRHGAKTQRHRGRPGAGHVDIAREDLPKHGVDVGNSANVYEEMYRLRFVRVVDGDDGAVEVTYSGTLTGPQQRFLDNLTRVGKRVVRMPIPCGATGSHLTPATNGSQECSSL